MYEAPALVQLADQQLTAAEKVDQMVLVQRDSGGDIAEKSFCTERNHKLSQYDAIFHHSLDSVLARTDRSYSARDYIP